MTINAIHVVAAVIYNSKRDQILIAKRPDHLHQGGLWEFPGGKVEDKEVPLQALHRELEEELTISIDQSSSKWLFDVVHDYPDKTVYLEFWEVFEFSGEPSGNEQQDILWVSINELPKYDFPEANKAIINQLVVGS